MFDYARAMCGEFELYIMGTYDGGELPFGPFWNAAWDYKKFRISRKLAFGRKIQQAIKPGNVWKYKQALSDATNYVNIHRQLVKLVGEEHSIDMWDHNITKTRIVNLALGCLYHWPATPTRYGRLESSVKFLAEDCILAGHLERENHHPEHGAINFKKLFLDRLCVHVQKDPRDSEFGWDVKLHFIPMGYWAAWYTFKRVYMKKNVDLYQTLDAVIEKVTTAQSLREGKGRLQQWTIFCSVCTDCAIPRLAQRHFFS